MSLTSDDIEDIKQLIAANNAVLLREIGSEVDKKLDSRFAQQTAEMTKKFDDLSGKFDDLSGKFDDLSEFVRDTIDTTNDATGEEMAALKSRVTALEQATS